MATAQEMLNLRKQEKEKNHEANIEKLNIAVDSNKQILVTKQDK